MSDAPHTSDTPADEPTVYNVVDLDRARDKFAKLAKRAKKLGVEAPGFEVIGDHREWELRLVDKVTGKVFFYWTDQEPRGLWTDDAGRPTGAIRTVHHVILTGVSQVKMEGWSFLATLDHDLGEGNTIVRAVPGTEGKLPAEFRHKDNYCDHCKRAQARKQTFVCLHEDGRLVQVGSTCIKDFLGHDAVRALGLVEMFALARGFLEDDELFREREPTTFDLVEYLAWASKAIREGGWLGRGQAREQGRDGAATADIAFYTMREFAKQRD